MSSKKAKAARRQQQALVETQHKPKLQWKTIAVKIVSPVGTIVGVLAALLAFWPRVTASISDPVNVDDPFSSSVTVTNAGFISLEDVSATVAVRSIQGNGSVPFLSLLGTSNYKTRMQNCHWAPHNFEMDDKFTFALNDVANPPKQGFGSADIGIVVDYTIPIPILHIKREKIFPFVTKKQSNSNFYWYSETVQK
jgi:hypothetical protein